MDRISVFLSELENCRDVLGSMSYVSLLNHYYVKCNDYEISCRILRMIMDEDMIVNREMILSKTVENMRKYSGMDMEVYVRTVFEIYKRDRRVVGEDAKGCLLSVRNRIDNKECQDMIDEMSKK